MASTAAVATVCAMTVVAVRWLAVVGLVRDYAISHTILLNPQISGGALFSTEGYRRQLGLAGGPSQALTHLDAIAWRVGFFAGTAWMLRLARRVSGYRIGGLRTVGVFTGFGIFIVAGAMHRAVDPTPRPRRSDQRLDSMITLWCVVALVGGLLIAWTIHAGQFSESGNAVPAHVGDVATLAPLGWSMLRNSLQLCAAAGGWSLATLLTFGRYARDRSVDERTPDVSEAELR